MSEEIIKVLDALSEKAGVAINWTSDNIVPYLQNATDNMVRYELITSIIWIVMSLILILISVVIITSSYKAIANHVKNDDESKEKEYVDSKLCMVTFAIIIICIGIVCIVVQGFDIVKCIIYPEKIIIDEIKRIII